MVEDEVDAFVEPLGRPGLLFVNIAADLAGGVFLGRPLFLEVCPFLLGDFGTMCLL